MSTINLSKKPKINLSKGQTICLTKTGESSSEKLNKVFFGASWKGKRRVDLDASLICYDADLNIIETIYYGNKGSHNLSIQHSGDDLYGGHTNDADNETISITLNSVQSNVKYIVATLNSFSGQSFDSLSTITARIYSGKLGEPEEVLCAYTLTDNKLFKDKKAIVLGYFIRNSIWEFKADGRTSRDTRIGSIINGIAKDAISSERSIIYESTPHYEMAPVNIPSNKSWFSKIIDCILNIF